jgi:hypothetical protein
MKSIIGIHLSSYWNIDSGLGIALIKISHGKVKEKIY